MFKEIVKTFFAIPTPAEIIVAVIGGLSIGIAIGYFIDFNGIKSLKDFKEIFMKNFKKR